jgi:HK97 family phage major capsid protein
MLKSLELKNAIMDLKGKIQDGINSNVDMTEQAKVLDNLLIDYKNALESENKQKNININNNKELPMEKKKIVNRVIKNLLSGRPVAEEDKAYMPKIVDAAGQYYASGTAAAGAYLVSEEFLPIERQGEYGVDLSAYCRQVPVTKPTGKVPTVDLSQDIELADFAVDNETEIAKKSAVFGQQPYTLANKGAIIPVGLDLLEDSDEDVVALVAEVFEGARIKSTNKEVITELGKATNTIENVDFTGVALIDAIKSALNEKLAGVYATNAKIVMSQTDFAAMVNLKDKQGRYYVQPVVTEPGKYQIDGREVIKIDNSYNTTGTVFVGDLKQIMDISRKGFEISSDLSSGFKTYSVNVRAVKRAVEMNVCPSAFVKITKTA